MLACSSYNPTSISYLFLFLFLQKEIPPPTHATVYIAKSYPPWQNLILTTLREMFEVSPSLFPELSHMFETHFIGQNKVQILCFKAVCPFMYMWGLHIFFTKSN